MSKIGNVVIEAQNKYEELTYRITDLKNMTIEAGEEVNEALRSIQGLTDLVKTRMQLIKENTEEIEDKEKEISLLGADYR